MKLNFSGPIIIVKDIKKSRKFYEEFMGEEVLFDFEQNIAFKSGLNLQQKDEYIPKLYEIELDTIKDNANNVILYYEIDDFDAFLKKLEKRNDIKYVHKEKEFDWRQRDIAFYDLDGYIVDVGEKMESVFLRLEKEGLNIEEIAKETDHPVELIKTVIKK